MSEPTLSSALIEAHRKLVAQRYVYENLINIIELPPEVTKEKVQAVKTYFLGYIYPEYDKRQKINAAFDNLDKHFKNPSHLLNLIGNGAAMAFKFGFQFPQALKAGLRSLESFKAAQNFEQALLQAAKKEGVKPPISIDEYEVLFATLPKKQLEGFIDSFDDLLQSLTDTKLLKKTVAIIRDLIENMKAKPDIYDKQDIEGIRIGVEILDNGYQLFKDMTDKEKGIMTHLIAQIEKYYLDKIFSD